MRVAVTGASGHIGFEICQTLIKQGFEVVALVYNSESILQKLPISIVKGSVLDRESLKILIGQCDVVIHTAGAIELGYKFNKKVYDINFIGTKNVFEIANMFGVKRTIYFSSVHVYNQQPYDLPVDEKRQFVNNNSVFYDQTKRDGHILAQEAVSNGQDIVIVCPTSVVGPPDNKPSKIGKAIIDIYKGYIPAAVKGGFDFTDVRDVAEGVINAIEKGKSGESYILGGKYHSIKELADLVLELKGTKKRLLELPMFVADIGLPFIKSYAYLTKKPPLYDRIYLDILKDGNKKIVSTKAQNELGYSVRELGETINDTLRWFKDIGKI